MITRTNMPSIRNYVKMNRMEFLRNGTKLDLKKVITNLLSSRPMLMNFRRMLMHVVLFVNSNYSLLMMMRKKSKNRLKLLRKHLRIRSQLLALRKIHLPNLKFQKRVIRGVTRKDLMQVKSPSRNPKR